MKLIEKRGSGILLHISSLPNNCGIGSFGKEAYEFVDFLESSGQRYWQILPLGQTSYGDSPYQSFSTDAGNPYFIDLKFLENEKLLEASEYLNVYENDNPHKVDYEKIYNTRFLILKKAFDRFDKNTKEYIEFKEKNSNWLDDYALFMALKREHNDKEWSTWEDKYRKRDKKALDIFKKEKAIDIEFWKFLQYKFYTQWDRLKKYANSKGIYIIGDIPIYVAYDSVDVWKNPKYFQLDKNLQMTSVAGCPPDAFSPTGQLWGNPLYDWEYMKKTKYQWWVERLKSAVELYDIVRIDHFRGFAGYYSIPYGEDTAINGSWKKGPGIELFKKINEELGELNIIAEDLGFLTEDVIEMLKESGYPGMKLLQFAFDSREGGDYLPHNYPKNSIAYIGTHDNDTARGWIENAKKEDIEYMREYLDIHTKNIKNTIWKLIARALATRSNIAVIQMQDYLVLDNIGRMNKPSTLGNNWVWRMDRKDMNKKLSKQIFNLAQLYKRI